MHFKSLVVLGGGGGVSCVPASLAVGYDLLTRDVAALPPIVSETESMGWLHTFSS